MAIPAVLAAAFAPVWFGMAVLAATAGSAALLLLAFPEALTAAWLIVLASMPDMWAGDIAGGGAAAIVAGAKVLGFGLAGVMAVRTGVRADPFNPGLAFVVMAAASLVHGVHPRLDAAESARSLLGSVAPFAFGCVAGSKGWVRGAITAAQWGPFAAVGLGAALAAAGLHPLFIDNHGLRLAGSGHPAFLAGFALTGVYASLVELFRRGRGADLALLAANFVILVGSGARAPLAIAAAVVGGAFLFVPSSAYPRDRRAPWVLGGLIGVAALVPLAGALGDVRLFSLLDDDASNLSGRETIWPFFEEAWAQSPVWGWGVGSGKMLVPEESLTAKLLGTTAAHNEYLRIGVDGGYVGLCLLGALLAAWAWWQVRRAAGPDKAIVPMAVAGFFLHARTDNVLIATTAVTFFAWIAALGMRARMDTASHPGVSASP